MPKVTLVKNDAVTSDVVANLLKQRFPNHEVYATKLLGADYVVKESGIKGAAIKVKQKDDKTVVVVNGVIPSTGLRILLVLAGILPFVIVQLVVTQPLANEVKAVVEGAPELRAGASQPAIGSTV